MRFFIISIAILLSSLSTASELAYVKTDSPRDTMDTFYKAMNDYKDGILEKDTDKISRIYDAIRTFAEKDNSVLTSQREKEMAAIFLKEVIDRVIVIDFNKIPDNPTSTRWRLAKTEIVLKKQATGDREGEWLITEDSWRRAQQFYKRVNDLPYLEGSGYGAAYLQPWMEKYLPEWAKAETLKLKNWQWLGLVLGFIIGLFIRLLTKLGFSIYRSFFSSERYKWKRDLLNQVERPVALSVTSLVWYAWIYVLQLEGIAFSIVNGIIQITLGFALTWIAYVCVTALGQFLKEKALKTDSTLDDQLIPFFEKAIKITVIALGVLLVLQNMGVNVVSILAGLGLGGLAFALAAQDTAANLFGSIMILVDRPFKVGDWVVADGVEGTVEEVGFRSTRIRTFYNSLITVPNAAMAKAKIDNMGERQYRRTRTTLGVTYDTSMEDLNKFIAGIREIIKENPISRKDYFHVYFSGYGDSSLNILVYFFLVTSDWAEELKHRQDIYQKIYDLADQLEVEFAFPTRTLHIEGNQDSLPPPV